MTTFVLIVGCIVAFASTVLAVPPLIRAARRRNWVDEPDRRKIHVEPVPRVGGLAIVFGFAVGLLLLVGASGVFGVAMRFPPAAMTAGALVMIATGMYDDIRGLDFKAKFALQLVVAYMLLHAGYKIDISGLAFAPGDLYEEALLSVPITVLWIVGVINAVNLIDGLDGLAAGVVLIAFAALGTVFGFHGQTELVVIAALIGGALIGFLVHNFNPASVFMGDSGSLFLGYMLAVFSLSGETHSDPLVALLIPVVAVGLPVTDTCLSIVRRLADRRSICAPDKDHIHHRVSSLWPHGTAVLALYAVAVVLGAGAVWMSLLTPAAALMVLAALICTVVLGLLLLGYGRLFKESEFASIGHHSFRAAEMESVCTTETKSVRAAEMESAGATEMEDFRAKEMESEGATVRQAASALPAAVKTGGGHASEPDIVLSPRKGHRSDSDLTPTRAATSRSRHGRHASAAGIPVAEPSNSSIHSERPPGIMSEESYKPEGEAAREPGPYVVSKENVTSADIDGEAVLLDLQTGRYFGVNAVGARIWQAIGRPKTLDEVVRELSTSFEVDRDRLAEDIRTFFHQMKEQQLVETRHEREAA